MREGDIVPVDDDVPAITIPPRARITVDVDNGLDVSLTGELALSYASFRIAAKLLEAVTLKARNDIELAQQKYREALAEFTRLSVADEG